MSLWIILAAPLLALAICAVSSKNKHLPAWATVAGAAAVLSATAYAAFQVASGTQVIAIDHAIALDGLGGLVLLGAAGAGFTAALFSVGYMGRRTESRSLSENIVVGPRASGFVTGKDGEAGDIAVYRRGSRTPSSLKTNRSKPDRILRLAPSRRLRSYYIHFNLFLFALVLVPVVRIPILAWIGIELTALFSVLLVAFDNTHTSLEAAWKYIAMTFMGAAMALLGFLILFWAFDQGGGGSFCWEGLRQAAGTMPPVLVESAFLFILIGLGTEVGLVPLHTWLPDAHSQAPSPACALLSGVKTTVALMVILRLVPLLPAHWLDSWLMVMGLISAGTAAFLLLQVKDYKRLFAFSTVEHMGIILVAASFGTTAGDYGAMFQILTHTLTKSFCFLAAGAVLVVVNTRRIESVQGLIRTSPACATALLLGALAIAGAPPAAVFLSEFTILKAGLTAGHYVVTGLLLFFMTIAFFGIMYHINHMVFGTCETEPEIKLPVSSVWALCLAAIPVLVLGIYVPGPVHQLIQAAAACLR